MIILYFVYSFYSDQELVSEHPQNFLNFQNIFRGGLWFHYRTVFLSRMYCKIYSIIVVESFVYDEICHVFETSKTSSNFGTNNSSFKVWSQVWFEEGIKLYSPLLNNDQASFI